jgi:hypothetical protein
VQPVDVLPGGNEQLRGVRRSNRDLGDQRRRDALHESLQVLVGLGDLRIEHLDAPGHDAQWRESQQAL